MRIELAQRKHVQKHREKETKGQRHPIPTCPIVRLSEQLTASVFVMRHNCGTHYSTEQFQQSSRLSSRQSLLLSCCILQGNYAECAYTD